MNTLIVCKHPENSKDAEVCRLIKNNGFDVVHSWKNTLRPKDLRNVELVIAIGGDGTSLSASHYLTKEKILMVNSAPGKSEGYLTTISVDDLDGKLGEIEHGAYEVEALERIEVHINGKPLSPLALNEVFIANKKAYLISKYKIKVTEGGRARSEEQRSSGLIFSTGTGSTAWFKSAGGKLFSPQAKHIKMAVREPYFGRLGRFNLLRESIGDGGEVEIVPLTKSILAIDSIREFELGAGDKIKIKISKWPLLRVR